MIQKLIKKILNRETILYIIFGVLTTLINIVVYQLCTAINLDYRISNAVAWLLSVLFAYITNKLYVFESKSLEFGIVIREFASFVGCRLVSGAFDMIFMIAAVEVVRMDDFIAKLCTNVFVVIVNYIFSKIFIFKKQKQEN